MLREVKRVLDFPKFSGLIPELYEVIIKQNKIKQNRINIFPKYDAISPRRGIPSSVSI